MEQITFQQLKKLAKKRGGGGYRLAVLGDCATQLLSTALEGYGVYSGLELTVFDADYDQIDAQVLDPASELYAFRPDGVLLQMCSQRLWEVFRAAPMAQRGQFARQTFQRIRGIWQRLGAHGSPAVLQCNFPLLDDGVFGQFGSRTEQAFVYQLRLLNVLLAQGAEEAGAYVVDLDALQARVGRERFSDPKLYYLAKMPIRPELLPDVARQVTAVIRALRGSVKKCVVLDLDNTLWGGVIGDDGLGGIQVGELGTGHAFSDLQAWLKELKNRGILLAVCSKNNDATAREPFEKHPQMVLRLEDFAVFVANWNDKASNIRQIQQTLNIGMDSLVFLDDNPFERSLVRGMLPQVTVPELPEDPAMYLEYLRSLDLFETAAYSADDADRTRQYQQQAARAACEAACGSYEDYLRSLDMRATAAPFDEFHIPRIAQLTQRSNQFNLRTVRCTEAQVRDLARDEGHVCLYFTLKDRFGDHGLISVAVMDLEPKGDVFISQWLMSCRVLKRGMEEFIIDKLIRTAAALGRETVTAEYIPTAKNAMVRDLYEQLGFERVGEHRFRARVADFRFHSTYITEEEPQ